MLGPHHRHVTQTLCTGEKEREMNICLKSCERRTLAVKPLSPLGLSQLPRASCNVSISSHCDSEVFKDT